MRAALLLALLSANMVHAEESTGPRPVKGEDKQQVQAKPVPAAAEAPAPATASVSDLQVVTVVEQRIGALAKIDRDVYDVKSNPATTNASAADVLNNVPAVSVDSDGKVTLRGSSNVRILVDGKPAAQFQGADGGANLSSLPAAALESVEVISTPGAEYGTEGGGGPILNLVMKRVQPPGARGNLSANLGVGGRYNANGFGTYSNGRVSADTILSVRHDKHDTVGESLRRRAQGDQTVETRQSTAGMRPSDSLMLSSTLNYNLGAKERLVATASLNRNKSSNRRADHIQSFIEGSSLPFEVIERANQSVFNNVSRLVGMAYERKFAKPNHELRIDLRYSSNESESAVRYTSDYLIAPQGRTDAQNFNSSFSPTRILDLSADYTLPLSRISAMKAGLKVARSRGERDQDYFAFDPLSGEEVFNADRSSAFASTELTYALYGSYDRWVTDSLMLRAGLRGEYTDQTMRYRQQQRAVEASNRYLMPNFSASYDFSKTSKLRLNLTQRVERPRVEDLNPFLRYWDEYNSFQGDPRISPQKTRNLELGWDSTVGTTRSSLRLTRAYSTPMFATSMVPLANSSTVISQRINFGFRQADTLSLNLNHSIVPGWTVNGTVTVGYDEQSYLSNQRGANGVFRSQELLRKGRRHQLQLNTNYRITPKTSLTVMAMRRGSQVTPFGVSKPGGTSTINLSHTLTNRVQLRFNLNDAFGWNKGGSQNDTGIVSDDSWSRTKGRIVYLGLSVRLGGVSGLTPVRRVTPAPGAPGG